MFPRRPASPNSLSISVLYDMDHPEIDHDERLLSIHAVQEMVGLSRPAIYRRVRAGNFPQALELNGGVVVWQTSKIGPWMEKHGLPISEAASTVPPIPDDTPAPAACPEPLPANASTPSRTIADRPASEDRRREPGLVTIKELRRLIGYSPATIRRFLEAKAFPQPVRSNGIEVFRLTDIAIWTEHQRSRSVDDTPVDPGTVEPPGHAGSGNAEDPDEWLSPRQVATLLGMSLPALERRVKAGEIPSPYDLGLGARRWKRGTIDEWIARRAPLSAERDAAEPEAASAPQVVRDEPAATPSPMTALRGVPARRSRRTLPQVAAMEDPPLHDRSVTAAAVITAPTGDSDGLLSLADVRALVRLGTTTIYARIKAGTFPRPRQLGPNCVRWVRSEVLRWIAALSASA